MKKLLVLTLLLVFVLSLAIGCGQQKEEAGDTSAAGAPEEVMDTTRMDSAAVDSMAGEVTEAVEEAAEEAGH